ncbi:MAG: enoyl-CoA hydratase/isomerase family protein [Paracoccaceae bacterium]|nr:enoyl-CoA hydratase/isomerase family protein [Paracoccaceae bacterium]
MSDENWLIRENLDGGIARIILNRPPVNAYDSAFLDQLTKLLDELETEDSVSAVILSSNYKVFSAGMDLKAALAFDLKDEQAMVRGLNIALTKLFAFPKPTIVAATGAAIAGGLFLVLASDYRVAGPKARFGLAEVRVGANFPIGPLEIARATLSTNDLRRLMLGGNLITAEAALAAGVVDCIEKTDAVMERAVQVACDYATIPLGTFAAVKRQIRGTVIDKIEYAMANGANSPTEGWFSAETKLAMAQTID